MAESEVANNLKTMLARRLQEFGFPNATPENVLTDPVYRAVAKNFLQGAVDDACGTIEREFVSGVRDNLLNP